MIPVNRATPADVAAWKGGGKRQAYAQGRMNAGEAAYADYLEIQRRAGAIVSWGYETVKLRLALRTFLTPDFRVVLADGTVEYHEVKGRKGSRFYCREDAWIKLKVAADRYPERFVVVWPAKGGGWCREIVAREAR
jgi:hypothetical protein